MIFYDLAIHDLLSDDTAHANESVFTREEVLETIRVISEKIGTVGLQVFPSLGNHDIIPKNQVARYQQHDGVMPCLTNSSPLQTWRTHGQLIMMMWLISGMRCSSLIRISPTSSEKMVILLNRMVLSQDQLMLD